MTLLPQSLYLFVKNNTSQSCRATGGQAGLRGRLIAFVSCLISPVTVSLFFILFSFT